MLASREAVNLKRHRSLKEKREKQLTPKTQGRKFGNVLFMKYRQPSLFFVFYSIFFSFRFIVSFVFFNIFFSSPFVLSSLLLPVHHQELFNLQEVDEGKSRYQTEPDKRSICKHYLPRLPSSWPTATDANKKQLNTINNSTA